MSSVEDEANRAYERIRDAIQRDQTSCRCGHLLAACADCRDWLIPHAPRIERGWRWFTDHICFQRLYIEAGLAAADAAERDDLAYFVSGR